MHADESTSNQRFTVKEAAQRLNVSEAAIRQRIQRDSIAYERDEETNRVYIILDEAEGRLDEVEPDIERGSERELIDTLQEQLRLERDASAELRRIIAGLTQRIPAIESPPEPRESPETASEETGNGCRTPGAREAPLVAATALRRIAPGSSWTATVAAPSNSIHLRIEAIQLAPKLKAGAPVEYPYTNRTGACE